MTDAERHAFENLEDCEKAKIKRWARIVDGLKRREMTAGDIITKTGSPRKTIEWDLKKLADMGVIKEAERVDRIIIWRASL